VIFCCALSLLLLATTLAASAFNPSHTDGAARNGVRQDGGRQGGGRIRPPDSLTCPHDHLTSFTGKVTYYRRTGTRVTIHMPTDDGTFEKFNLRFRRGADVSKNFLLWAEAFKASDWRVIEKRSGQLRPGMRATVWVCDDRSTPVVDWQPIRN
jgi:hypothetical protein